jgi:hypothetical protein
MTGIFLRELGNFFFQAREATEKTACRERVAGKDAVGIRAQLAPDHK